MDELKSLDEIFTGRIFKIPDYQRGYAWEKKQLKDFWEDIINLPEDKLHYTGMLSLKKVDTSIYKNWNDELWLIDKRNMKPFHVVDGQQRLTTFIILIQVFVELFSALAKNAGKEDDKIYLDTLTLSEVKEKYLVISQPPNFVIKSHKFGYEIDNPSFKYLRHCVLNEPDGGDISETFYTLNLENSKHFFIENLENYHKEFGEEGVCDLFIKLTHKLMFNVYEISDDFDVFVAFETMNNRGKRLSNLELLKNRLIYLTTLYDKTEFKDDERFTLRREINDAWKDVYFQLGRNKRSPLNDDDFLSAHWIIYFQYSRKRGDDYRNYLLDKHFIPLNVFSKIPVATTLFQEFDKEFDSDADADQCVEIDTNDDEDRVTSKLTPKEIQDYSSSLKESAKHWYNTFNPLHNRDLSEDEQLWLDRLNRLGFAYFRPLVCASYLSKKVKVADRINLLKAIEKFIFIVFRLSRAQSSYGSSVFYNYARELRVDNVTIVEIIKKMDEHSDYLFKRKSGAEHRYIDHEYFYKHIEKIFNNSGNGYYGWSDLRYFLYEYELEKLSIRSDKKIDWEPFVKTAKDKVSVEHVYPQSPEAESWSKEFGKYSEEQLLYLKNSLGNLVPLSQSINSSLQNDSFDLKKQPKYNEKKEKIRTGYSDGSHSEIEVSEYKKWTPTTILERGFKLLEFMELRWNFRFENDEIKKKLLFLSFIKSK